MSRFKDPYVYGSWTFNWYTPEQDLRPRQMKAALGIPYDPTGADVIPYQISNRDQGRSVRFRSLAGGSGPGYVSVNQEVPFLPGSISKFVNVNEAEVDLRVLFTADTQKLLWAGLKNLPYLFQPQRGIGTLEVINPAGAVRRLNCRCISGFALDESTLQEKSVEASLTFLANDPYWYSPWLREEGQFVTKSGLLPGLPVLPRPTGSSLFRDGVINEGDVNTFPFFLVQGPFNNPFLVNQSINPNVSFNNTLDFSINGGVQSPRSRTGQVLSNPLAIDCQNKNAWVVGVGAPSNPVETVISKLTRTSSFFYLQPGNNELFFSTLGATNNTLFIIYYRNAYSTMI